MCGWLSAARIRDSRSKRDSRSGSSASARGNSLIRNIAVQLVVPGAIDLAHAAGTE